MNPEFTQALKLLVKTLEKLGISYYVGGSVASSTHGLPRTTMDIDMVMELALPHISSLVPTLEHAYLLMKI